MYYATKCCHSINKDTSVHIFSYISAPVAGNNRQVNWQKLTYSVWKDPLLDQSSFFCGITQYKPREVLSIRRGGLINSSRQGTVCLNSISPRTSCHKNIFRWKSRAQTAEVTQHLHQSGSFVWLYFLKYLSLSFSLFKDVCWLDGIKVEMAKIKSFFPPHT